MLTTPKKLKIIKTNLNFNDNLIKLTEKLENSEKVISEHETVKNSWEEYDKESLKKIKVELDIKENQ